MLLTERRVKIKLQSAEVRQSITDWKWTLTYWRHH